MARAPNLLDLFTKPGLGGAAIRQRPVGIRARTCWLVALLATMAAVGIAGEPIVLERGHPSEKPQQPQVAVDALGTIHVVYGIGHGVRYRRSADGGQNFTPPVDLPVDLQLSLGMRRGPRIAATRDSLCISVIGGKQGKGRDGDVLAFVSRDRGATWSGPARVNDVADSAREGLHAMTAGPSGDLGCVWLDLRNRRTEIMSSTSSDGGRTWSKNTLVYQSPDGSVCECCHPSVVLDGTGRVHVLWRNSLAGARDMYWATSADGGRTFGPAAKLGAGTWPLNACPMDGGAIAVCGDRLASCWRRERTIYLSQGTGKEQKLGEGEQPWMTLTDQGPYVVWLKKRGDAVFLLSPDQSAPRRLAAQAADPVIVSGPEGRGPVVAAWESREANRFAIMCQVVGQ